MKKNIKFLFTIFLFIIPSITIASVTIANNRYSSIMKLPWLGNYSPYDSSNDIGTSNYGDSTRFECKSGSCPGTATSSGVVFDSRTGLYWQSSNYKGDGSLSFNVGDLNTSITFCDNLIQGGYNDWRLPNVKELLTLKDFSGGPNQDKDYYVNFFDLSAFGVFWSSTKSLYNNPNYNTVSFSATNGVGTGGPDATYVNIICVR